MRLVCFDKGTFSQIWRCAAFTAVELENLRHRLRDTSFARRPTVLIGPLLITEMSGLPVEQRQREFTFLSELPEPKYLKPSTELIPEEIRAAREGRRPDPFQSVVLMRCMFAAGFLIEEMWEAEKDRLQSDKEGFVASEHEAQIAISGRFSDRSELARALKEWYRDPVAAVHDWAKHLLRNERSDLPLPEDESDWPDVRDLPSVWAHAAYQVARIYLINRDGRSIQANDFPDWHHFRGAVYADDFIVDDKGFRAIAELCPPPKPKVVSFEDWACALLA